MTQRCQGSCKHEQKSVVDVAKHPPIAGANAQLGKQSASSAEKRDTLEQHVEIRT